jgi:predicted metalloprotease
MSYPLFAFCDDRGSVAENVGHTLHHFGGVRKMWTTFGRIARKRILFVAHELQTDALAGVNTIRETP